MGVLLSLTVTGTNEFSILARRLVAQMSHPILIIKIKNQNRVTCHFLDKKTKRFVATFSQEKEVW